VYLLSFGGFLLLGGRLCDYTGSKRIFMTGMFLFGAASTLALVSHHISLLLLARAGQGIGAALAMPGGISLLGRHFKEGAERQSAIGIFGAFAAIGFAGGLALGGLIASLFNWHWIFGVNVPIITGVLITGHFCIPQEKMKNTARLNLLTAVWLTATLLIFCYSIHELTRLGWRLLPCLTTAILSGIELIRYDRRQQQPFFPLGLFSSPSSYRALGASFLLGACFLSFVFLCTLSLSEVMHLDIRSTGLLLFPYSIGSALVSKFLLPRLFRRVGVLQAGRLAMSCLLGGVLLLLAGIYTHQLAWFLVALLLVNSLCIAIGYPAFTILSLSGVPSAHQGIAAGLQSATYTVGTGMGLSVIGLCLQSFHPDPVAPPAHHLLAFSQCARGALWTTGVVIGTGCITALFLLAGRKS
jgi:MFS family permease